MSQDIDYMADKQKSKLNRGVIAGKFQGNEGLSGFNVLNRTGPIKIAHGKKMIGKNNP